jgi:hypothetical protein
MDMRDRISLASPLSLKRVVVMRALRSI